MAKHHREEAKESAAEVVKATPATDAVKKDDAAVVIVK